MEGIRRRFRLRPAGAFFFLVRLSFAWEVFNGLGFPINGWCGMAEEGERVRRAAELRESLKRRIEELESQLNELRSLLELVEDFLKEKSFKKLEVKEEAPAGAPIPKTVGAPASETVIPITTIEGVLLANLHVKGGVVKVIPAEGAKFNVNTPPFQSFLVGRVLSKMRERDEERAANGEIPQDEIISYEIREDDGVISEIEIRNVKPQQLRELKSTIRWTLRRMYEKMTFSGKVSKSGAA